MSEDEQQQTTAGPAQPRAKSWLSRKVAPRAVMAVSAVSAIAVIAVTSTGHPGWVGLALLPSIFGALFLGRDSLARRGFFPRSNKALFPALADATKPSIGLGVSVGKGAVIMPGAIVEMGATIGAGAVIESGAVVRMGADVHADAVIEKNAVVSWGADVKRGARVSQGARIGAGATVGKNAVVPADTWVMPGGDWRGGDAQGSAPAKTESNPAEDQPAAIVGTPTNIVGTPMIGIQTIAARSAPVVGDPRQIKLDAVFARIDRELLLSPPALREHLRVPASGVAGLRATCRSLLERERSLRAEAEPAAIARLDAERDELAKKIARADDEVVKLSLASAVAAIEEQKRQRLLLARSADRLDAEATRLYWTLDALAAQLVRMRSAGAENASSPDAELMKSVEKLQLEIVAIADALEQVTQDDRAAPMSAQHAVAPPEAGEAEGKEKATATAEAQRR